MCLVTTALSAFAISTANTPSGPSEIAFGLNQAFTTLDLILIILPCLFLTLLIISFVYLLCVRTLRMSSPGVALLFAPHQAAATAATEDVTTSASASLAAFGIPSQGYNLLCRRRDASWVQRQTTWPTGAQELFFTVAAKLQFQSLPSKSSAMWVYLRLFPVLAANVKILMCREKNNVTPDLSLPPKLELIGSEV